MGNNIPTPLYPEYQQRFGFSTGVLTVIFAVAAAGVLPSLLLIGPLSDRLGRRPILLFALAMVVLSTVCFLLADSLDWLLVARFIAGVGIGALAGTAGAALAELAPNGDHARAALVSSATTVTGQAVGPLLAGILTAYAPLPLRLVFWVDLGLIALAVAGVLIAPETVDRSAARRTARRGPRVGVPPAARSAFLLASLAALAAFGVLGLISALGPTLIVRLLHVHNRAVGGLVVFGLLGTSALVQILGRGLPVRITLFSGCGAIALGMGLVVLAQPADSLVVFATGIVIAGAGQGLTYLSGQQLIDSVATPELRGQIFSTYFIVLYLSVAVAALGVGFGADWVGFYPATCIVAGAIALAAAATVCGGILRLRRKSAARSNPTASPRA
jgi:MFS family permease